MRLRPAIRCGVAGLTCLLALLAACARQPESNSYVFSGRKLGTSYNVKVIAGVLTESDQADIGKAIEDNLDSVNAQMSTYQSESELSRFNQAGAGVPVELSRELFELFTAARQIGADTGGAFDITVGPLVNAWGFGPDAKTSEVPPPERLRELAGITGWDKLRFPEAGTAITKAAAGVYCDLSGIAKGYAVDRVSVALRAMGYGDHMAEVGGEVQTRGLNADGEPWRIGVERPAAGGRAVERVLRLRNLGMATSGDYRNYFEKDGVRYSHIIDPRTGRPVRHRLASVSVIDESCMKADAFATALMVLGEEEGPKAAEENGLAALFLVRAADGSFIQEETGRFRELFGEAGP